MCSKAIFDVFILIRNKTVAQCFNKYMIRVQSMQHCIYHFGHISKRYRRNGHCPFLYTVIKRLELPYSKRL